MKKTFIMAIVGYGGMGSWHGELIDNIENLTVKGIYDIAQDRCEVAKKRGYVVYQDLESVLSDPEIDFILCATPNDTHKEIVVKALKAKKHVVCEKPAALSKEDFKYMLRTVKEENTKLFIHQNRRWDEDYLTIKKIVEEQILGNTFRIESRVHGSRGIPGDWRNNPENGGGMVYDWGVHIIDQALCMIPKKITSIYATLTHITNELVDDGFTAELTFEDGTVFLLEVGTNNFISLPRWYALGINGTAIIHDWSLSGEILKTVETEERDAIPIRTAAGLTKTMAPRTEDTIIKLALPIVHSNIQEFYKNVMNCILGKEEPYIKNEEILRCISVMEAIFESAHIKQKVLFE